MVTKIDEQQAQQVKEFLKRAEVRTMKKDLQKLREFDALKERDKIAKLKTIEEQQIEAAKKQEAAKQKIQQGVEKQKREEILGKNTEKEREAEKDLKKYAEEGEKQQIFLLESQRVSLEDQIKNLETKEEPELALEKNRALLEQKNWGTKLNSVLEEEKKREDEQKYVEEKENQSAIPAEKKSLEERRSELEDQRQEVEKKRWAVEKELAAIADRIKVIDQSSQDVFTEKNGLHKKIKEIDNSLRAIYSGVIAREEEKRRGEADQQKMQAAELSKTRAEMNERVQREQWTHSTGSGQAGIPAPVKNKEFLREAPSALKEKLAKSFETEEEQRKKFMQTVEEQTNEENQK